MFKTDEEFFAASKEQQDIYLREQADTLDGFAGYSLGAPGEHAITTIRKAHRDAERKTAASASN